MGRVLTDLRDDDPITLTDASALVLRGAVTVSALRAEVKRGNLIVEKIGKNLFTTPAAIRQMRERCRVQQSPRASISEKTGAANPGSSGTARSTGELDTVLAIGQALKNGSLNTLRKNTPADRRKADDPIPFPSRKS